MTGDCHAGICGSRGLRCPRLPDGCLLGVAVEPRGRLTRNVDSVNRGPRGPGRKRDEHAKAR